MKKICLFLFLIANTFCLEAAVFEVTSNADAGIGTLRQAIISANANGTAQTDFIHFKLPGSTVSDVTIMLVTELPILTSNIVIDGTLQPFAALNNPNIKISLFRASNIYFNGLRLDNARSVEIYGIVFSNFKSDPLGAVDDKKGAIFLKNSSDITIGAPNKPNCFSNNSAGIISPYVIPRTDNVNIKISSNIIGLGENGRDSQPNESGIDISFLSNSVIGGDTSEEGNLVSANTKSGISLGGAEGAIKIANNVVGLDKTLNKNIPSLMGIGINVNGEACIPLVLNNVICSQKEGLLINFVNGGFKISGNTIGTGVTGNENFANEIGIHINLCDKGMVGGKVIKDNNQIAFNKVGLLSEFSYPISILKNSFYCNNAAITFKNLPPGKSITQSQITTITAWGASGTYLPNSTIELFYTDSCPNCEGKTWLATVSTDANGNWSYNGPINGKITSMGTNPDGATATFSKPFIVSAGQPYGGFCGLNNGGVSGVVLYDWSVVQWYTSAGQPVPGANSPNLLNVPPGKYYFKAGQLGLCDVTSGTYDVPSLSNGINDSGKSITSAYCGKADGSIKGIIVANNLARTWYNSSTNNIVGTNDDLENMPAGTYYFTFGQGACFTKSLDYEIPSVSEVYKMTNVLITPVTCNGANGKIVVSGNAGNASFTFKWFNSLNVEIGDSETLVNLSPGKYRLEAYSSRGCSNIVGEFDIVNLPLPIIDYSSLQKFISCDGKTVSTSGITVLGSSEPYTYRWVDESNKVISDQLNLTNVGPGKYVLSLTDRNGCLTDGPTVDFNELEKTKLVIPNSITPNGDGVNDVWKINGAQLYNTAEFSIYSRDGNRIFHSKGYAKPFDGIYNGSILPVGVYYYVIDLKNDCGKISGSLTILR